MSTFSQTEIKSIGRIHNTHQATIRLLLQTRRRLVISLAIFSILLIIAVLMAGWNFFIAANPLIVVWFGLYVYANMHVTQAFMRQFAKEHNLSYREKAPLTSVSGRLFAVGHSKKLLHVMSGTFKNYPMRLFTYKYSIGSGRRRRTHFFTIMETTFPKTIFPFILLRSTTMARFGARDTQGKVWDTQIPLEPVFEKHFQLFTSGGYEIEALQIFTPTVLKHFMVEGQHLSIEFADNKMYIYDDQEIGVHTQLEKLYGTATRLFTSLSPLLDRLHDDFAVLHPYYNEY